jgi:hypothetical protein
MKTTTLAGLAATALLAALPASGQNMFDNFDSYPTGSINGLGGWQGWTGNAAVAGTVTSALSSSAPNSLQLVRGNDTVRTFSGVSSGLWTLSMQQYIPSTSGGRTWTILMNQYPANLNWSGQVLADITGSVVGYFNGAGTQQGATLPLLKDQWVDLRFDINLTANSVSAYYNNTLMATTAWQSGGINQLQALDLYPDEDSTNGQVGPVYYDNVSLVPEPSSFALLTLGGLALAMRRKLA